MAQALDIDLAWDDDELPTQCITPPRALLEDLAKLDVAAVDCEHESVLVMVPHVHGIGFFPMWCEIAHQEGDVLRVLPEDGWRAKTEGHGYPACAVWVEELLGGLARVAFLRRHPR